MNRGKYSRRHRASLWREIVENANGWKRVQCDDFVFHKRCGFMCPRSALMRFTEEISGRPMATFHILSSKSSRFLCRQIHSCEGLLQGGMDNRCQYGLPTQHDSTGRILEKRKSNFFSSHLSKLRAVTLALSFVKASLTRHRILIMTTTSWPQLI